ncbi:hypothetical protein ANA_C13769 [Anabaena sp. 90]|nr:hypothetical protein ANA_C13769 [Anabaena sp. 90]
MPHLPLIHSPFSFPDSGWERVYNIILKPYPTFSYHLDIDNSDRLLNYGFQVVLKKG